MLANCQFINIFSVKHYAHFIYRKFINFTSAFTGKHKNLLHFVAGKKTSRSNNLVTQGDSDICTPRKLRAFADRWGSRSARQIYKLFNSRSQQCQKPKSMLRLCKHTGRQAAIREKRSRWQMCQRNYDEFEGRGLAWESKKKKVINFSSDSRTGRAGRDARQICMIFISWEERSKVSTGDWGEMIFKWNKNNRFKISKKMQLMINNTFFRCYNIKKLKWIFDASKVLQLTVLFSFFLEFDSKFWARGAPRSRLMMHTGNVGVRPVSGSFHNF